MSRNKYSRVEYLLASGTVLPPTLTLPSEMLSGGFRDINSAYTSTVPTTTSSYLLGHIELDFLTPFCTLHLVH